jgi:uncharacterized membrane protein
MDDKQNNTTMPASASDVEQNKMMAILAYILFFVPLLAAKDSPFAKYHANQGLILFLFGIVGNVIGAVLSVIVIGLCISAIVNIVWLVYAVLGIINAANGQMKPLPGFGNLTLIK